MLRALRGRDFRLLWIGQSVSLIGDGIYLVAIAWLVYDISNEPGALALVGLAWTLPQVGVLLLAGVLSDRFERRRLLVVADLIRFAAIGSIAALSLAGVVELWHVVVLVVFYGVGQALFQPAFAAIVPDVVPRDQLLQANALRELMEPLGMRFGGPALGGFLIAAVRRRHRADGGRRHVRGLGDRGLADVAPAGHPDRARLAASRPGRGLRVRARALLAVGHARRSAALFLLVDLRTVRGAAAVHHPQRPRRRRGHVRRRACRGRARLDRRGADPQPHGRPAPARDLHVVRVGGRHHARHRPGRGERGLADVRDRLRVLRVRHGGDGRSGTR